MLVRNDTDTIQLLQQTFSCLERCRVPVIAAVQGGCIGGGVDMVTACDLRYATQDAFFCVEEINIGMTADVGRFRDSPRSFPRGSPARWPTRGGACRRRGRARSVW
jgi:enoyl-CoA hydratase